MRRFGKFSMVGVLGAVLQLILFELLLKLLSVPKAAAAPIAVELAIVHNFIWHERFTWRNSGPGALRRLGCFHLTNGLLPLAGNTALIWVFQQMQAPALPSAVAAIALCAPANFILADRCTYRAADASRYNAK